MSNDFDPTQDSTSNMNGSHEIPAPRHANEVSNHVIETSELSARGIAAPDELSSRAVESLAPLRDPSSAPKRARKGRRGRRRTALLSSAFALSGVIVLGSSIAAVANTPVPNALENAPVLNATDANGAAITWVGDTYLADKLNPYMDVYGTAWPSALLSKPDASQIMIANLEGPVTDLTQPFDPIQQFSYNARKSSVTGLSEMGIDAVSVANNHAMDRGPQGLQDTLNNVRGVGIKAFGGGNNSDEARLPLVVQTETRRIAIAGFADSGGVKSASMDRPGHRRMSFENFVADYELAKRGKADFVVAFVHWGENYAQVDDRQRMFARALVDAGYDMIIGAGPHVAQPIEVIDGVPVVYSLGNYVFGTSGRYTEDVPGFGLVVTTSFSLSGDLVLSARCIENNNELVQFQARPCTTEQTTSVFAKVNPSMQVEGTVAKMIVTKEMMNASPTTSANSLSE